MKRIAEQLLASRLAGLATTSWRRGARLVLAYHNVVPSDAPLARGDRSLHLTFRRFRDQLDLLQRARVRFVPVDAPLTLGATQPEVAITFDDAYASAMAIAVPELAVRGIPATVFVAPGILGARAAWWDLLALPPDGVMAPGVREVALDHHQGKHVAIVDAWRPGALAETPLPEALRIATERELESALGAHAGLMVGAHTWSHPNLTRLAGAELEEELVRPLEWLRARWGDRTVPWLAYPYGLAAPALVPAVERAGYEGSLLVQGGWQRFDSPAHGTPRFNVSAGLSTPGFGARLNGFLTR